MKKLSLLAAAVLLFVLLPSCFLQYDPWTVSVGGRECDWRSLQSQIPKGESLKPLMREHLLPEKCKMVYDMLLYTLHMGESSLSLPLTQDEYTQVTENLDGLLSDLFTESVFLPANNMSAEAWRHTYSPLNRQFTLEIPERLQREISGYRDKYDQALAEAEALKARFASGGTDLYEAARQIYAYIINHVTYALSRRDDPTVSACTAWDALVRGEAQCEGFAKAVVMVYSLCGIECSVVTCDGTAGEPGHAWNLVLLDGEYYYIDCTNAGGSKPGLPSGLPDYGFCMTDTYMRTVPSYEYDPLRAPAFGGNVRLRTYLPANTGRYLRENPYYLPDADATDGVSGDVLRAAFAEALQSGRDWIWVLGPRDELAAAGVFQENGDGTFTQTLSDALPEDKQLRWEWTDGLSWIYLMEK